MPDQIITSEDYVAVTTPGVDCKMQVHDAPCYVTFTAAPEVTRGIHLRPGDLIPVAAADAPRVRKAGDHAPTLTFEVFG